MTAEPVRYLAWTVGLIGALGSMAGWWLEPTVFPHAWLAALSAWIGWPLGCLALVLIHALTGGRWGEVLRPQLMGGIDVLPLLLPAILPMLFVLPQLYPWTRPAEAAQLGNAFYLNIPFGTGRGIFYLIVWFGLGALVGRNLRRGRSLSRLAPVGLILLGVSVTFASIDATMSLDPHFVSSAYGMIAASQAGLLALSISVLGAAISRPLQVNELDDAGRLLLGLLILWAYLDFMQLLIVWQSDLPPEAHWYIERLHGGWGLVALLVLIAHFVLPFFALMSPRLRRSACGIAAITALLVLMGIVRAWWLVLPAASRSVTWVDVSAILAMGGLSAGLALRGSGPYAVPAPSHG